MDFINRVAELFNIHVDNELMDMFNKINNNQRNIIYNVIIQQVENTTEPNQYCCLNFLTFLIISTFTKNKHHPYCPILDNYRDNNISQCIDDLVNEEYISYINQGEIKLILLELYNQNDNKSITDRIISILDILSNKQLYIIMNIEGSGYNGESLVNKLIFNSQNLYMVNDVLGNDYYNLHFDFELGNDEKEEEINHLEKVYNENDMINYFCFSINKLFNSDIGITSLRPNIGMTRYQLAYCLYYCNHPLMNIQERFHKFVNVLTLEQLIYVGV